MNKYGSSLEQEALHGKILYQLLSHIMIPCGTFSKRSWTNLIVSWRLTSQGWSTKMEWGGKYSATLLAFPRGNFQREISHMKIKRQARKVDKLTRSDVCEKLLETGKSRELRDETAQHTPTRIQSRRTVLWPWRCWLLSRSCKFCHWLCRHQQLCNGRWCRLHTRQAWQSYGSANIEGGHYFQGGRGDDWSWRTLSTLTLTKLRSYSAEHSFQTWKYDICHYLDFDIFINSGCYPSPYSMVLNDSIHEMIVHNHWRSSSISFIVIIKWIHCPHKMSGASSSMPRNTSWHTTIHPLNDAITRMSVHYFNGGAAAKWLKLERLALRGGTKSEKRESRIIQISSNFCQAAHQNNSMEHHDPIVPLSLIK